MKMLIGKREVGTMAKNILEKITVMDNLDKVENYLISNYNAYSTEVIYNDKDGFELCFDTEFMYSGAISKKDCEKLIEDFSSIERVQNISMTIKKEEHQCSIECCANIEYMDIYGDEHWYSFKVKELTKEISLQERSKRYDSLKGDIVGLSSGTISSLLIEQKVGVDASSMYSLIETVQARFLEFTIDNIEKTKRIPLAWQNAWEIFTRHIDVKGIAYELGIDESKIESNYDLYEECNIKLSKMKSEFDTDIDVQLLNRDSLIKLSYAYALSVLKRHCKGNKEDAIEKVKNQTVPKILNGEYDDDFYIENAKKGLKILANM